MENFAAANDEFADYIDTLLYQPIDIWLAPFTATYQAGMDAGISAAYTKYISSENELTSTELVKQFPEFEQENQARTQALGDLLRTRLAEPTAQDFKAMDIKLRLQIVCDKGVRSWDDAKLATDTTLNQRDFVDVYFYGFQYGYQLSMQSVLATTNELLSDEQSAKLAESQATKATSEQYQFTLADEQLLQLTCQQIWQELTAQEIPK